MKILFVIDIIKKGAIGDFVLREANFTKIEDKVIYFLPNTFKIGNIIFDIQNSIHDLDDDILILNQELVFRKNNYSQDTFDSEYKKLIDDGWNLEKEIKFPEHSDNYY